MTPTRPSTATPSDQEPIMTGTTTAHAATTDLSQVPSTVTVDGRSADVIAAAFIPGGVGVLAAHVVAYKRPSTDDYATGILVHDDDEQKSYLTRGNYDLTLTEALVDFALRVAAETTHLRA